MVVDVGVCWRSGVTEREREGGGERERERERCASVNMCVRESVGEREG